MRYAYLDIETASDPRWLAVRASEAKPSNVAAWAVDHAADGATSPLTGLVTCIGLAFDDEPVQTRVSPNANTEADLLRWLLGQLDSRGRPPVVGHNLRGFDVPFLRARAMRHGVSDLAQMLYQEKPWSTGIIDTLDAPLCPRDPHSKKGWGLVPLAKFLGVEVTETTPGEDCPKAWYEMRYRDIVEHCAEDVRVLREVHRALLQGVPA